MYGIIPLMTQKPLTVAYFTMEVGLRSDMPTYAGGLGILAADLMRSCADLKVPAVCVTVCWKRGYMRQHINLDGTQQYEEVEWHPADFLQRVEPVVEVSIEGRTVRVGAWLYELRSDDGMVPIVFLDTNLPENEEDDRGITERLYGGDQRMRLKQEVVLGIGGVRMLRALGYQDIGTFHMNEGHAAFLTLELLRERGWKDEEVRRSCTFTTHTPIQAGHDVFDYNLASRVLGDQLPWHIKNIAGSEQLSMSRLAISLSRKTFGVSNIHAEVSRRMFPGVPIEAITNGVHHLTWACPEMQALFDTHADGWRENPNVLTKTCRTFPPEELWNAHQAAKGRLIEEVNRHTNQHFDVNHLTIASARRVVPYKRPELIYTNLERLKDVCLGKVQIIHAGNAHPSDQFSQDVIRRMVERASLLKDSVKIVYLENYNPDLAKLLTSGADIWLNTPMRLHEASGTSGMKACLNGVLTLSTLDGWWIEGYGMDPEAGWRIGPLAQALDTEDTRQIDAEDVYTQLQYEVIPEYEYEGRARWIRRMMRSIGLIGYFNTHRCVKEYLERAWRTF